MQVAGLSGYDEDDDGGSTDGSVGPSSDGGVQPASDAMAASDGNAVNSPRCVGDQDCLSGTACDLDSGRCAESPRCPSLGTGKCTTLPQCGCEPGFSCVPERGTLNGANQCVPAGTVPPGGECTGTTSCQLGFACYDGECLAFCDPKSVGTDGGCPGSGTCLSVATTPPAAVCAPTCTPTITCSGNCDFRSDFQGVPVCTPADGTANVGDPCDNGTGTASSVHCSAPLFCASTMVCENPALGAQDCPDGSVYTPAYNDLSFGYCTPGSN